MPSSGQRSIDVRGALAQHGIGVKEVIHGRSFSVLDGGGIWGDMPFHEVNRGNPVDRVSWCLSMRSILGRCRDRHIGIDYLDNAS